MWQRLEIAADFAVLKHRLADVKTRVLAEGSYHVGDTDVDHLFASEAGFRFFWADATVMRAWRPDLFI